MCEFLVVSTVCCNNTLIFCVLLAVGETNTAIRMLLISTIFWYFTPWKTYELLKKIIVRHVDNENSLTVLLWWCYFSVGFLFSEMEAKQNFTTNGWAKSIGWGGWFFSWYFQTNLVNLCGSKYLFLNLGLFGSWAVFCSTVLTDQGVNSVQKNI